MISKQAVFKKSAQGAEAIATRQAGLTPKLRSALIMVDGKRSFGDLAPMVSVLGDPEVLLTELESAGFIELVGAPAISQSVTPSVEPASTV